MMMQEHDDDGPASPRPKGSKPVSLLFTICAMLLAAASSIVMAASGECSASAATVTYVFLVRCTTPAAILEAAAVYLQLRLFGWRATADDDYEPVTEKGMGAAGIVLVLVDELAPALLYMGTAVAFTMANTFGDQIRACARFAEQLELAKILSLTASVAAMLAAGFRPRLN